MYADNVRLLLRNNYHKVNITERMVNRSRNRTAIRPKFSAYINGIGVEINAKKDLNYIMRQRVENINL